MLDTTIGRVAFRHHQIWCGPRWKQAPKPSGLRSNTRHRLPESIPSRSLEAGTCLLHVDQIPGYLQHLVSYSWHPTFPEEDGFRRPHGCHHAGFVAVALALRRRALIQFVQVAALDILCPESGPALLRGSSGGLRVMEVAYVGMAACLCLTIHLHSHMLSSFEVACRTRSEGSLSLS